MTSRRKLRLLLTISEFVQSSQLRNLLDLVSHIDRDAFDLFVGALSTGDDGRELVERCAVPVFPFRLQPTRKGGVGMVWDLARSPIRLVRGGFDVVHSLLYQSVFTEALLVRAVGRAKYVFTKSNLDWDNHATQWRLKCRLSNRIVSISSATSSLLDSKGFGEKIEHIPLGIDETYFKFDDAKRREQRRHCEVGADSFVFGCAAQFMPVKDHLAAVRSVEQLADRGFDVHLLLCGPNYGDSYYQQCRDYILSSRHARRIHVLGTLSDMPAFYSAIDALVLPSRAEAFGYVLIEAMSCSRPVIACRAAGPAEIVADGECGVLVESGDQQAMTDAMEAYVSQRALADQHGVAGQRRVRRLYSSRLMAERSQALYRALAGKGMEQ